MGEPAQGQRVDAGDVIDKALRALRLDTSVFDEVRDATAHTVPAALVVVAVTLLGAIGGWLWLAIEYDGLDGGRILLREFFLGSIFALALWAAWVLLVEAMLSRRDGHEVDRMTLVRTMGYAAAPGAIALLVLIPSFSLGIGLISLIAWAALNESAVRAAVPAASVSQIRLANLVGAGIFVLVLSFLGHQAGMAPGAFVHAGGVGEYIDIDFNPLAVQFESSGTGGGTGGGTGAGTGGGTGGGGDDDGAGDIAILDRYLSYLSELHIALSGVTDAASAAAARPTIEELVANMADVGPNLEEVDPATLTNYLVSYEALIAALGTEFARIASDPELSEALLFELDELPSLQ